MINGALLFIDTECFDSQTAWHTPWPREITRRRLFSYTECRRRKIFATRRTLGSSRTHLMHGDLKESAKMGCIRFWGHWRQKRGMERRKENKARRIARRGSAAPRDRRTPEFIILSSRQARQKPITSNPAPPPSPAARRLASPGQQGSSWKNPFHRTQSSRP